MRKMRKSRYSEEQIIGILRLAEAGQTVAEMGRQHGISEGTHPRWKAQYGRLAVSRLCRPPCTNSAMMPSYVCPLL